MRLLFVTDVAPKNIELEGVRTGHFGKVNNRYRSIQFKIGKEIEPGEELYVFMKWHLLII